MRRSSATCRHLVFALAALLGLVAGACSGGGDDELTVDADAISQEGFLAASVDRSTRDGFNFSMTMSITLSIPGAPDGLGMGDVPFATGQVDGARSYTNIDMGELLQAQSGGQVPAEMAEQFRMEVIQDEEAQAIYLRAPLFAALAAVPGSPDVGTLAELGETWGRVDAAALGDLFPEGAVGQLAQGAVGFEPMLQLVESATDSAEAGSQVIRGVEVTGVSATVTFSDIIGMSGMDVEDLTAAIGQSVPDAPALSDAMSAVRMPLTVWVDDDARIHRVEVGLDMEPLFEEIAEVQGEDLGGFEMRFGYQIDAFDHGAPDPIDIPTDTVDVTDAYRDYLSTVLGN